MERIVSYIICTTFEKVIKRWQTKNKIQQALQVTFNLRCDYDKEEGYRHLDLLIYGRMNYVGVYARERWDVISIDDLDGEDQIKLGCDYTKGSTDWQIESYHDSCWTSGVENILMQNKHKILTLGCVDNWYEIVNLSEEMIEMLSDLTRHENMLQQRYEPGKDVFSFK